MNSGDDRTTTAGRLFAHDEPAGRAEAMREELSRIERAAETRGCERATVQVCKNLARLKTGGLYRAAGAESFKAYLRCTPVSLSYSTAVEWAKIGQVLFDYAERIEQVGFSEEDGLKKLLHLEQALSNHESSLVFTRLKHDSYRVFRDFAQNARAFRDREQVKLFEATVGGTQRTEQQESVFTDGLKLYLDVKAEGRELLSFNSEYLDDSDTRAVYTRFMKRIRAAAEQFFTDSGR
jgi:hypothetical protein